MKRRGFLLQRSAIEWIVRAVLAVAIAATGYYSVTRTLAYALRNKGSEIAAGFAPEDGRVLAILALKQTVRASTPEGRARANALARKALRRDPTAVKAVTALGLNAHAQKDAPAAKRFFTYAQTLSRREIVTHLWGIENAVARNDVAAALKHYDAALRTSRRAPEVLFPQLASAIRSREIRAALIQTLTTQPPWGSAFMDYTAGSGSYPRANADLFAESGRAGVPVSEWIESTTVDRLIKIGDLDQAWAYYVAVRSGVDRRVSRDSRFTAGLTTPSLFDWTPISDGGITASLQSGPKGGLFDFVTSPSVGGPLLQQMQVLPPGNYRLEGHSTGIDQPPGSRPYWVLGCSGGRELGRVSMPNSADAEGKFSGRFAVPSGCPVQTLVLVSNPASTAAGVSGQIDLVRLAPDGDAA